MRGGHFVACTRAGAPPRDRLTTPAMSRFGPAPICCMTCGTGTTSWDRDRRDRAPTSNPHRSPHHTESRQGFPRAPAGGRTRGGGGDARGHSVPSASVANQPHASLLMRLGRRGFRAIGGDHELSASRGVGAGAGSTSTSAVQKPGFADSLAPCSSGGHPPRLSRCPPVTTPGKRRPQRGTRGGDGA